MSLCGNNKLDAGEMCDGSVTNGKTCASFGFSSGILRCSASCSGYDTSGCVSPKCGDGVKNGTEISEEMILRLHFIHLSKIEGYEKYRGVWRPVNVMIRGSTLVFPHHSEVPGMMHGLLKWHHENRGLVHPVELAARFHTKFTTVHPFADGNGRMARLLMNYILQANGMPFANIPLRRRAKYMKTQEAGNAGNDKPFALFLAEEVIKQSGRLKKK